MKISFHGAARSVTGSRHLVQAGSSRLLLDCGMFHRRRDQATQLNRPPGLLIFSAHADRNDLLAYVRAIQPPPQKVFVVHGEERQSLAFAMILKTEFPGMEVEVPRPDSTHEA
jgi:Cft2 family RNA processing exonuclease